LKTLVFPESEESAGLAGKYGYDSWLVGRFLCYVPKPLEFLAKMDQPPTQYIRANKLKTGVQELAGRLESRGFQLSSTPIPEALAIRHAPLPVGATPEYLMGHYYIQDLSSCMAADALDVSEGQSVLDIAAAPGGKTTFIAQRMKNTGSIVALEPNEKRARSMSFNLARCGVSNACVLRMDGAQAEKLGKFDRVLLDAPCSCEGVIAKDAKRKTSHEPQDVDQCSNLQGLLIESAARMVKPGGVLVYSTCSFAPEENELVVDALLRKFDNITIEPYAHGSQGLTKFGDLQFDNSLQNARRLYPHIHDTTGFFIARLRVA
jgi:NOL1/NOP2/sun family putative RNA methylase